MAPWQIALEQDLLSLGLPPKWKWHYFVTHRVAWFTRRLRVAEHFRGRRGFSQLNYFFNRLWFERVSERMSIDIPLGVFKPGLSIAHRGSIIVNGKAEVGENCRIHPGVTIGASHGRSPRIGRDVFIGPNALIIGGIEVGDGAIIGPGAFVNASVPAGFICLASRATVKDSNAPAWNSPESDLGPTLGTRDETPA